MNVLSLEYVAAQIQATKKGVAYDPTGDTVQFAFKPRRQAPQNADWTTGLWDPYTVGTTEIFVAKILVGPGGTVTLAAGTYVVWVRIVDNPEQPVLQAGTLVIDTV